MRVTTKGQVTIPKDVRDRIGVGPGSEVEFVLEGNAARIVPLDAEDARKRRKAAIQAWAARVAGTLDLDGMTSDEYFQWIRGPRDDLDPR
jgi:AbrB family looped-hinge helix DNA binding protein